MSINALIDKYGVKGNVKISDVELPVIGIPMMDDEQWQQLARENAVSNYRKVNGKEPNNVYEAVQWQRERCAAREKEAL